MDLPRPPIELDFSAGAQPAAVRSCTEPKQHSHQRGPGGAPSKNERMTQIGPSPLNNRCIVVDTFLGRKACATCCPARRGNGYQLLGSTKC